MDLKNKVISAYRVMDDGVPWPNRKVWAISKYKDLSITDLVKLLNTCQHRISSSVFSSDHSEEFKTEMSHAVEPNVKCQDCTYACSFVIEAKDIKTLAHQLKERHFSQHVFKA